MTRVLIIGDGQTAGHLIALLEATNLDIEVFTGVPPADLQRLVRTDTSRDLLDAALLRMVPRDVEPIHIYGRQGKQKAQWKQERKGRPT